MPLDREHMTWPALILLVAAAVFFPWVGSSYIVTPTAHLTAGSVVLHTANGVLPLPVWGAVFSLIGALILGALWLANRTLARYALVLAMVCMGVWSVVTGDAFLQHGASYSAPAWPLLAGAALWAANYSLVHYRTQVPPVGSPKRRP